MTRGGNPWRDRKSSSLLVQLAQWCCSLARVPLTALGVDVKQLRTILGLRLSLDLEPRFSKGAGETSLGLILSCIALWLSGLAPGVLALVTKRADLWMGVGQATTLALALMLMFSQYGALLVDPTDVRVITPLPVSDRTLFAARFGHALFYTAILSACAAFFPATLGAFEFPPWWALTIYPLSTFLTGFTALAFVSLGYALLLRIVGPGRFQRAGVWIQIAGTSTVVAALQIGPRFLADKAGVADLDDAPWLRWIAPPMHQLGLYELLAEGWTNERAALAILALTLPIAGLCLALALASKHFIAALSARESHATRNVDAWRPGWFSRIGARIARTPEERAGYDFALALSRRERTFLRVTVPQLVMFAAMGLGSLRANPLLGGVLQRFLEHMPLAFTALFGPLVIASTMSESFDARWRLRASPVADWPKVGVAALRALFAGMVVPSMLAIFVLLCVLSGGARVVSLLVALELAFVIALYASAHIQVPFPFCNEPRKQTGSLRDLPVVLATVFVSFPAAAVAAATSYHWAIAGTVALALAPVCVWAWRRLDRTRFLTLPA